MNRGFENPSFIFDPDDVATEQGITRLLSEVRRQQVIWIEGKNGGERKTYLEISIVLDNYLGLQVRVIESTQDALRDHIHDRCSGWDARSCNIQGVNTTDYNMVVDPLGDIKVADGA